MAAAMITPAPSRSHTTDPGGGAPGGHPDLVVLGERLRETQDRAGVRVDFFVERVRGSECFVPDGATATGEPYEQAGFAVRVRHRDGEGYVGLNSLSGEAFRLGLRAAADRAGATGFGTDDLAATVLRAARHLESQGSGTAGAPSAELLRAARSAAVRAAPGTDSVSVSYSGADRAFLRLGPGLAHLETAQRRHLVSCRAVIDGAGGPVVGYRKAGVRDLGVWDSGLDIVRVGRDAGRAAAAKTTGRPVAERNVTLVIAAGASGVLVHELLGHPLEGDVAARRLAGVAWHEGDRIGPAGLHLTDDPGLAGGWGGFTHDDEGTPARPQHLVREGTVTAFLDAAGRRRRQSFRHPPATRMSNVYLAPGPDDPAALTASVDHGFHVARLGGGRVHADGTFAFGAVDVRRIRRGVVAEPVSDAVVTGHVTAALAAIRGLGDDFAMGSPAACVKYGQEVPVGDGGPTLLVTGVDIEPAGPES
ncbi:TldD/PmbA family protein [Streptomyces sp. NPDC013187]|uniref:TldD/PmbA family protein n=1 Tax=Streptomyces sp. NPDC013187 TaxID=3364865 RepID=UPI0036A2E12F